MSTPIVRIVVVFGVVVLLASAICLIYPLVRSRVSGIGLLAQALVICVLAGVPLAFLGAHVVDLLRPGLDGQAPNQLSVFPAGQGLIALLVQVTGLQDIATPNLWASLGAGAGFGAAIALAFRSLLNAPVISRSGDPEDGVSISGMLTLGWCALLIVGAVVIPIVAVAAGSKSPPVVMQLVPGDEAVIGFGAGLLIGAIITSTAASLIDLLSAVIARITNRRGHMDRDESDSDLTVLSSSVGASTPLVFWVTAGIAAIVASIASYVRAQDWGDLVVIVLFSPLVLIIVAWPGLISSTAAWLRTAIAAGVGEKPGAARFDWYALLGGVIFGLILAGGSHVPLLGWLLGVIGTLGWAGLLVGVVFGLVLAVLPLVTRVLLALPNLAWVVFGCALVTLGGILILTPTWLS